MGLFILAQTWYLKPSHFIYMTFADWKTYLWTFFVTAGFNGDTVFTLNIQTSYLLTLLFLKFEQVQLSAWTGSTLLVQAQMRHFFHQKILIFSGISTQIYMLWVHIRGTSPKILSGYPLTGASLFVQILKKKPCPAEPGYTLPLQTV